MVDFASAIGFAEETMIQTVSSPYQGVPLGVGPLVPIPTQEQQSTDTTTPAPMATEAEVSPLPPSSEDPEFKPWYKKPVVIVSSIAGIAALGGIAWWAFKAPKRRRR